MPKKIMVIDDDASIVEYLTDLFTDNGYVVCSAADGALAMDVVRAENPDLITLDLEMPQEWGPRFYRKLSQDKEHARIPVIVISGLPTPQYAVSKALATLAKPFDKDKLLAIVNEVIGS